MTTVRYVKPVKILLWETQINQSQVACSIMHRSEVLKFHDHYFDSCDLIFYSMVCWYVNCQIRQTYQNYYLWVRVSSNCFTVLALKLKWNFQNVNDKTNTIRNFLVSKLTGIYTRRIGTRLWNSLFHYCSRNFNYLLSDLVCPNL